MRPLKWLWVTFGIVAACLYFLLWLGVKCVGGFFEGMKMGWTGKYKKPGTYGDAAFAEIPELKKRGNVDGAGFLLGFIGNNPITAHPEASVVAIAKKGYGKSLTLSASIRREDEAHLLIMDASGDIYEKQAEALRGKGYNVRLVDLTDPERGEGYNPLSFFKHSNDYRIIRDITTLGYLTIPQERDGKHFTDIAREMLCGFVYVEQEKLIPGSLYELANILTGADDEVLARELVKLKYAKEPTVNSAYTAFTKVSPKERGSFHSTMSRLFKPLMDPAWKYLSANGGWCWEDIFESPNKEAVFIVTGLEAPEVTAPFTRLFLGLAVASAGRYYNAHGKQPIPRGLRLYVDEADLLGECRPIIDAVTKHRKTGVNVWLCYQSLSQLGESAKVLFENSDLWITGGLNDDALLKKVSFLAGNMTITKGEDDKEEGVPLIAPDAIRSLGEDEFMALLGNKTVRGEKSYTLDNGVRFK